MLFLRFLGVDIAVLTKLHEERSKQSALLLKESNKQKESPYYSFSYSLNIL